MSWRAPLRLAVGPWEPAASYLARLAARNRMTGPGEFARLAGTTVDRLVSGRDVALLETAAGLLVDTLVGATAIVDAPTRSFRLARETFRLKDRVSVERRWCPRCVAGDPPATSGSTYRGSATHRSWWDLTVVAACPIHGTRLENRCPSCGDLQPVLVGDVSRCRCGADLSGEGSPCADGFGCYVYARLTRADHDPIPLLDEMSLIDAVPFVERLGLVAMGASGIEPSRLNRGDIGPRLAAGLPMAVDWPNSFLVALDRIVGARGGRVEGSGMLRSYGWIHEFWIPSLDANGAGSALREQLHRHAVAHGIVAEGEAPVGRGVVDGALSLTTASRRLGMGHARTSRLLRERRLIPTGARRGVAMPIDRAAVEALRSQRDRRLDLVAVRRRLGVGKVQARSIAERFVPSLVSDGIYRGWCAEGFERFLDRLSEQATVVDRVPDRYLPLHEACRAMHRPMHDVLDRVLAGELRCVRLGAVRGVSSILVDPTELGPSGRVRSISLKDAAARLSLHHEALLQLLRMGAIDGERRADGWSFQEHDLTAFDDRYATATRLAHDRGVSPRRLVGDLAGRGIYPAYGPPACRQIVFDRRAVASRSDGKALRPGAGRRSG